MTTEAFLAEMRVRAAQLRGPAPAEASPAGEVDAYRRAAAVLHVFDPRTLQPVLRPSTNPRPELVEGPSTSSGHGSTGSGPATSSGHIAGLVAASVPAVGFRGRGLRTLPSAVRLAALAALGSRAAMREALAANPDRERTGVQQVFETWLNEAAFDLGRMRFTELEGLRQLYAWASTGSATCPTGLWSSRPGPGGPRSGCSSTWSTATSPGGRPSWRCSASTSGSTVPPPDRW